uniref:Uncharacterized protein n=1 Tax=Anopheles minimus TaxID=112268 RepID=A0A182WMW7_9DIPT
MFSATFPTHAPVHFWLHLDSRGFFFLVLPKYTYIQGWEKDKWTVQKETVNPLSKNPFTLLWLSTVPHIPSTDQCANVWEINQFSTAMLFGRNEQEKMLH